MKGKSFALLWSGILDSSLWLEETKETRLLWVTMLALKDADGKIIMGVVGLEHRSKLTRDEVLEGLKRLSEPDPNDHSGVEEGRRIREIEGGWQIVNHDMYRFSTEAKREFWRQQKEEQRQKGPQVVKSSRKRKPKVPMVQSGTREEQRYVKQVEEAGEKPQDIGGQGSGEGGPGPEVP